MKRLHIVRTRAGAALARSLVASGEPMVAFAPGASPQGSRHSAGDSAPAEIPSAAPEELVHRIFESDVAIVW